jgi:hypothetical protein
MKTRRHKLSRAISTFVDNPVTNLVKGIVLLMIGLIDASQTFHSDLAHGHPRVGHGMVIIGSFGVLGALPHILNGLEASLKYLEKR